MIGRLTGTVVERAPGRVVLDVGGVGYELSIPLSTFYDICRAERAVTLQVHTHVRDDALQLFGFATVQERTTFEHLLAISGVGPKLALAVLSGIEVDELERAVRDDDRARLERIPGVGRKTAERILLELRDRLAPRRARGALRAAATPDQDQARSVRADAVSALANLGYAAEPAARAVDAAVEDLGREARLEDVLRGALRQLVR